MGLVIKLLIWFVLLGVGARQDNVWALVVTALALLAADMGANARMVSGAAGLVRFFSYLTNVLAVVAFVLILLKLF